MNFVTNEQVRCHRPSNPFSRFLTKLKVHSMLFSSVTRKGLLLAEWPGESIADRLQRPWRGETGDSAKNVYPITHDLSPGN